MSALIKPETILEFPNKKITAKDFHVLVAKSLTGAIFEFSEKHLDLHKRTHNPDIKPEYYTDIHEFGLDYIDTILVEKSDVDFAIDPCNKEVFDVQLYRKGKNPKYNLIKDSMTGEVGFDLRQKPIQVIIDDDGKIVAVFNGNTTHSILSKFTNLQNRIVAVYKKNRYFSKTNLILIGANQNSLEKEAGINTLDDLKRILDSIRVAGGLTISKGHTEKQKLTFISEIHRAIKIAGSSKFKLDGKVVNSFINDFIEEQTQEKIVYSVTDGAQVMRELSKMYIDTPSTEYNSISAFAGKVMLHFTKKYFSFVEAYEMGNTKVRPENMRYEVILHMGDVDPSNPVKDFFHKYAGFWTDYQKLEYFASNVFVHKTNLKNNFRIIGAFQQSKEVEALDPENFPFGKVIDFDTIMEYYNNYYLKGKKKTS